MNIDQKLEIVRKALELGARLDLVFHDVGHSDALSITEELSELTGIESKDKYRDGTNWFKIEDYDEKLEITVFYDPSKETYTEDDIYHDESKLS